MTKKVFRPFWTFDVQGTEEWLSSMAAEGYHLQRVTGLGSFIFIPGDREHLTFFINYDKRQENLLPSTLQKDGWRQVFGRGKWSILANNKPVESIKTYPLRGDLLNRNNLIMYVTGFFAVTHFLSFFVLNLILLLFTNVPVNIEPSPFWSITIIFYGLVYYSFLKLYFANKKLAKEISRHPGESPNLEGTEASPPGKIIRRTKLGWMYAPDKLERWLEKMEEEGYNLHRTGWSGTVFYFLEGKPRRVKYCADFQYKADNSYFDIHKDAGWKEVLTRGAHLERWTIWSREYGDGEEEPRLYSSKSDLLKNARRVALTYSAMFVPFILLYGLIMSMHIDNIFNRGPSYNLFLVIIFGIGILLYGSNILRTWLYYRRLRKLNM